MSAIDSAGDRARFWYTVSMPASRASIGDLKCTALPVEQDFAAVGDHRTAERLDQRRLAGAVVADDRQDFARHQVEIGVVERHHPAVALVERRAPRGSALAP